MKDEGIQIYSITVQNEPLHPHNNPSMLMLAEEQANFIKNHLGPKFEANNINTKIIIYDHNADRTDYPISILNDEIARQYFTAILSAKYPQTNLPHMPEKACILTIKAAV